MSERAAMPGENATSPNEDLDKSAYSGRPSYTEEEALSHVRALLAHGYGKCEIIAVHHKIVGIDTIRKHRRK